MVINFHRPRHRSRDETPLYVPAAATRVLRVVFDETSLVEPEHAEEVRLLRGLTSLDHVARWSYSEAGPPKSATLIRGPGVNAYKGWLVVEEVKSADRGSLTHIIRYSKTGSGVVETGISGDLARADRWKSDATYSDMGPERAAEQRRRDSVASGAADAIRADILVTTRPFLLKRVWFADRGTVVCSPTEALALVGQFLRSRGLFMGWHEENWTRNSFSRSLYYWVAARALLPEGWRWFSQCVGADPQYETDLANLGQSAFQRLGRVLRSRDSLRWTATFEPTNSVADEAAILLDYILIDLVGAFDATARVAHRALGLDSDEYMAGWRRSGWRKAVREQAPHLASAVAPQSVGGDLLDVLGILRNTVHGAALQPIRYRRVSPTSERIAIALPRRDVQRLTEVFHRRGWGEEVGLTDFGDHHTFVMPEPLADHLLKQAVPLLNTLMRLTPVERLGASVEENNMAGVFAPKHQRSLLLQFGLTDTVR